MRPKRKVMLFFTAIVICGVLAAVGPCTITHKYGPYYGKVIDSETGEPIAGVYLLMAFYTEMYTPAGFVSKFVETRDAMTDKGGEFRIEAYRAWAFRFPQRWDPQYHVTVFKPGYGAIPLDLISSEEHVTFRLPKLRTYKERLNNLHSIPPVTIPDEKLSNIRNLINEEYKNLGYKK